MLIALSLVVLVLLPCLYLVLSIPERVIASVTIDGEEVIGKVRACLRVGDTERAIKLCDAVDRSDAVVLTAATRRMLVAVRGGRENELDTIEADARCNAARLRTVAEAASVRRVLRDAFAFGLPTYILYMDRLQTGWIIGPLVLCLMVVLALALVARLRRINTIGMLMMLPDHLKTIRSLITTPSRVRDTLVYDEVH